MDVSFDDEDDNNDNDHELDLDTATDPVDQEAPPPKRQKLDLPATGRGLRTLTRAVSPPPPLTSSSSSSSSSRLLLSSSSLPGSSKRRLPWAPARQDSSIKDAASEEVLGHGAKKGGDGGSGSDAVVSGEGVRKEMGGRSERGKRAMRFASSPIQLTRIRDLPPEQNVDAISLRDILGDPLIKECWQFNYLFDIEFLMSNFDEDVRSLVRVNVVHGSWKREDSRRLRLEEQAQHHPNVRLITAHMPEAFGTHHSKMMVLLRHDDTAQVVIHTANMIEKDWTNMTQAVWRSPFLPLLPVSSPSSTSIAFIFKTTGSSSSSPSSSNLRIGTGLRFKKDLLNYFRAYGSRLRDLVTQLTKYDFSAVRAAFIASVPCRQPVRRTADDDEKTAWAWPALRDILSQVPCRRNQDLNRAKPSDKPSPPQINIQVSSIATLGTTSKWLDNFASVLSTSKNIPSQPLSRQSTAKPKLSILFPTPPEIRLSLDGYAAGGSIHMKLQSAAQQKQLEYLKPYLCYWAPDLVAASSSSASSMSVYHSTSISKPTSVPNLTFSSSTKEEGRLEEQASSTADNIIRPRKAYRQQAPPHIKTYIRFSSSSYSEEFKGIDWFILTSANLSTQAWGALPPEKANGEKDVRVQSYETGVVLWPELFAGETDSENGEERLERDVVMVPVFGKDEPALEDVLGPGGTMESMEEWGKELVVVGVRMPYDLPLVRYQQQDTPWCATATYEDPDWLGMSWRQ